MYRGIERADGRGMVLKSWIFRPQLESEESDLKSMSERGGFAYTKSSEQRNVFLSETIILNSLVVRVLLL